MWFEAVCLGIIVGLMRGGRLNQIDHLHIKGVLIIFLGLLLQMLPFFLHVVPFIAKYAVYFTTSGVVLAFIALLLNYRQKGFLLVIAGTLLQMVVLFTNNLKMPIRLMQETSAELVQMRLSIEAGEIANYALSENAHIWTKYLGKMIIMPDFYPFGIAIGLPDLLIAFGLMWWIQSEMVGYRMYGRTRRHQRRYF